MGRLEQIEAVLDGLDGAATAEVARALHEFDVREVAAVAAQRAINGGGGGGGSQTFDVVHVPFTFDTADISPPSYPVTDADTEANTLTISGDHTAVFTNGATFEIADGDNSGTWTVDSSAFAAGDTTIVVVESLNADGPGGTIVTVSTQVFGVEIHTPSVGDTFLYALSYTRRDEEWDGSSPTMRAWKQGAVPDSEYLLTQDLSTADPDSDLPGWAGTTDAGVVSNWIASEEAPLMLGVTDGQGRWPGASQGAAELVLVFLKATA